MKQCCSLFFVAVPPPLVPSPTFPNPASSPPYSNRWSNRAKVLSLSLSLSHTHMFSEQTGNERECLMHSHARRRNRTDNTASTAISLVHRFRAPPLPPPPSDETHNTTQGLAAYALGASLLQSGVRGRQLTLFVLAFSAMTPVGILLGAIIEKDGEDDTAGAVCVALAAGTFLYVSLMEVLPPELASTEHGWAKLGSLLAGFSVSAGVGWLVG